MKELKVFVASPGDVGAERDALEGVIHELNRLIAPNQGAHLNLIRWETHTRPSLGRPQGVVNAQIGPMEEKAMFIGIMWARFGSPTGMADSGTEEEFRSAKEAFDMVGQPEVMFYFCERPIAPRGVDEAHQIVKVQEFKGELQKIGLLGTYESVEDFERKVRQHLTQWLYSLTQRTPTAPLVMDEPSPLATAESPPTKSISVSTERSLTEESGLWVLLDTGFLKALKVSENANGEIELELPAASSLDDSAVRTASRLRGPVAYAQGNDAALVEVVASSRVVDAEGTRWQLTLRVKDAFRSNSMSEGSIPGHTADDIGILRARLILLDERSRLTTTDLQTLAQSSLLAAFISGISTPIKAKRGAIPDLASQIDPDNPDFLPLARLYAILLLRGSYAVGNVDYLALERESKDNIQVSFRGRRPQPYQNAEVRVVEVEGSCPIRSEEP